MLAKRPAFERISALLCHFFLVSNLYLCNGSLGQSKLIKIINLYANNRAVKHCNIFLEDKYKAEFPGGGVLPYMGYIGMCDPKG